jgi:hypothetical protein
VQFAATFPESCPARRFTRSRSYTNAEIAPSLGRNLATALPTAWPLSS